MRKNVTRRGHNHKHAIAAGFGDMNSQGARTEGSEPHFAVGYPHRRHFDQLESGWFGIVMVVELDTPRP